MAYNNDKEYPKSVIFNNGDVFRRCPLGIYFNRLSGTHPIYGRVVLSTERISEHKLIINLGEVSVEEMIKPISDEAVVAVYGEIDDVITYGGEDEFSKLWIGEENEK